MEENKDKKEEQVSVEQENTSNSAADNAQETPEQNANEENQTTSQEENLAEQKPTDQDLLAEEKDRYLRLYAEFENFKRRTSKEKMEFFKYASQDLMVSMLGVLDDFERAIKEITKNGNTDDLKGIELIYQKFKSKLVEKGLKAIEVNPGDTFNVDKHEAITQIPSPTPELKGKIVDAIETGYELQDKVIRFTKVVVGS